MDHTKLLAHCQAQQPEMLGVIETLVSQDAAVELIPNESTGMHVRATFGDSQSDQKPALILCHYDTVWPVGSLETHPFRVDEQGWAYGPGIFDMQSSIVLSEYVLRAVTELDLTLPRPVTILITSDEETGSHTSRALIEAEALKSAYALVMESPLPGGVLKTTRKGGGHFELHVTGKAAHAGVEPEAGISAIQELAQQILMLHELTEMDLGSTVNVGVISGGTVSNTVAAEAHAVIDTRAWTQDEADRLVREIQNLSPITEGIELEITGGWNRPPLERKVTGTLFEKTRAIGEKLGLALEEGGTGGGSDGNLTGALGVPTLDGLGVPGHGAHADHEHIETDKIHTSLALLVGMLMEL